MKRIFSTATAAAILLCVSAGSSFASVDFGKEAEVISSDVQQKRLFEMDRAGDKIVVVGDMGLVKRSLDGGATWSDDSIEDGVALLGVSMAGEHTVAVGQEGAIYRHSPQDGWKKVESETKERLLNVDGNEQGLFVAVGAFGTVLESRDYGSTWRKADIDWVQVAAESSGAAQTGAAGEPTIYAVQVLRNGSVVIGGELSLIAHLQEGTGWQISTLTDSISGAIPPTVNSINIRDDGTGYAAGQAGLVLKTCDRGVTWSRLPVPGSANLLSISSLRNGMVVAVGMRNSLYSRNGGKTWETMNYLDFPLNWYSSVNADQESGQILTVGHSARIVKIK